MTQSVEPLAMDLELPSNGDYVKTWALLDKNTGASLIDTTALLRLDIKATQDEGATALISLDNTTDPTVSGFVLASDVDTSGQFTVTIRRTDLESQIASGQKKVSLFYDFGVKYTDGFFIVYASGRFVIDMGVTLVS